MTATPKQPRKFCLLRPESFLSSCGKDITRKPLD
ncbi:hypothetical protein TcasGA2_TC032352 [Tribolium castaneum]|uniref:Uncharacterized protein n=1 Tax=Tribolium castaneum TaxID=7070 RepID=A0A139WLR7_TRICA|nr:hypothetical protein TcasGA2_TC032352 [Tribolium castaneum]